MLASEYVKDVPGYGYNMPVVQVPGAGRQSSELVMNADMNSKRPEGSKLEDQYVPTYGTNAAFFDQEVPRVIPPNWQFIGQPDGSSFGLGSPFYRYTSDVAFGKRRKQYMVEDSACNRHRNSICKSMPNCTYTKGRGCRRRKGTVKGGLVYQGPSLAAFGKRRRKYFVEDSACNRHRKSVCQSMPNCTYTKGRGCRRRAGTVKGGLVYQGPSLAAFGKRRRRRYLR
jgi:hypothetical protein